MEIGAIVCSVALALASVFFGVPQVQLRGTGWTNLRNRGIGKRTVRSIGVAHLIVAVVLIAGLFLPPLGILGCIVAAAIYLWMVGMHVTYGDYGNPDVRSQALLPLAALVLSIITLVFAIASS